MSRVSAYWIVAALTGVFAVSAHAETRSLSWQGQQIEASVAEPTRGIGPSREELMRMAREAVPSVPTRTLTKDQTGK
jgi:hypothetical protein